jgi:hypothetical protein
MVLPVRISEWRSGYVVGAGLEYGINPNWVLGVEYNCMDFGGKTWNGNSTGRVTQPDSFNDNLKISTVTGRIIQIRWSDGRKILIPPNLHIQTPQHRPVLFVPAHAID